MKVWITRYALTKGIIEAEAEPLTIQGTPFFETSAPFRDTFAEHECFTTSDKATEKAEQMRTKRIASLNKQIAKLEKLKFE